MCPTLTLPYLTSSGSSLRGKAMKKEGSREEAGDAGAGSVVGYPTQKPDSYCLPSTGQIHQLGNGFTWDLVGRIWEASYLWTSAWNKEGRRKWIAWPTDFHIPENESEKKRKSINLGFFIQER